MGIYNWSRDYTSGPNEPGYPATNAFNGLLSTGTGQGIFDDFWFAEEEQTCTLDVSSIDESALEFVEFVKVYYCAWCVDGRQFDSGIYINDHSITLQYATANDESDLVQRVAEYQMNGTKLETISISAARNYESYTGITAIEIDGVRLIDNVEFPPLIPWDGSNWSDFGDTDGTTPCSNAFDCQPKTQTGADLIAKSWFAKSGGGETGVTWRAPAQAQLQLARQVRIQYLAFFSPTMSYFEGPQLKVNGISKDIAYNSNETTVVPRWLELDLTGVGLDRIRVNRYPDGESGGVGLLAVEVDGQLLCDGTEWNTPDQPEKPFEDFGIREDDYYLVSNNGVSQKITPLQMKSLTGSETNLAYLVNEGGVSKKYVTAYPDKGPGYENDLMLISRGGQSATVSVCEFKRWKEVGTPWFMLQGTEEGKDQKYETLTSLFDQDKDIYDDIPKINNETYTTVLAFNPPLVTNGTNFAFRYDPNGVDTRMWVNWSEDRTKDLAGGSGLSNNVWGGFNVIHRVVIERNAPSTGRMYKIAINGITVDLNNRGIVDTTRILEPVIREIKNEIKENLLK